MEIIHLNRGFSLIKTLQPLGYPHGHGNRDVSPGPPWLPGVPDASADHPPSSLGSLAAPMESHGMPWDFSQQNAGIAWDCCGVFVSYFGKFSQTYVIGFDLSPTRNSWD